ncbi:hypothetical protein KI387_016562, partial [Taxus chinensis]
MRETHGSADSGEAGKRRTNAFWDTRDMSARSTRFGWIGRKGYNGSGKVWDIWDENATKYAVRVNRPKMEQLAQFDLGHLGHESA